MPHVGLVHRDLCECKVKGFSVFSSIEKNVSKKDTCKGCDTRGDGWYHKPPSRSALDLEKIDRSIISIVKVSINIIYFQTVNIIMHPILIGLMDFKKLLYLLGVPSY